MSAKFRTDRTFTFWRFLIQVPLSQREMPVTYSINNGQSLYFFVPGLNQNMNWAAYSVSLGNFTSVSWSHSLVVQRL